MENLIAIWDKFDSEIISFSLTLIFSLLAYYLRSKVKLVWGQANKSWHSVQVDAGDVNIVTEKYFVQNLGRAPACSVEIVYTVKPTKLMIFPQRDYSVSNNPDGAHIVNIPYVSPRELVTLDAIYIGVNQGHILSVKCKEQEGKHVPFFVVRRFSKTFYAAIWALIFLGVASIVSILLKLLGL